MSSGKIPVILVTGFLGSGKTTLLRHLASSHPDWRMIFLVNEFADNSVDALTLEASGTPTQSVVGGSLFCECKAGEFVRVMKEQVLAQHEGQALDAVVIETSGIADPEAIGELMQMHGLAEHFAIHSIVCVVAVKRFRSLFENLPAVQGQIRTSNLIVLNKTDLADASTIAEVEQTIQQENPGATQIRATHCAVDLNLGSTLVDLPKRPLFTCEANPFSTREVLWPNDRSIEEAIAWLKSLPATILRIKGTLRTPERSWHVERTVDTLSIEPQEGAATDGLVLIAHDDDETDLLAARP